MGKTSWTFGTLSCLTNSRTGFPVSGLVSISPLLSLFHLKGKARKIENLVFVLCVQVVVIH